MSFVILQRDLEIPPVDKLQSAFGVLPDLVAVDAHTMARDAFGILLRGLELESAVRLQEALRAEGLSTEMVPEDDLPGLPPAKLLRRADSSPESLVVYDAIGRPSPLESRQIVLIAAGAVRSLETRGTHRQKLGGGFKKWDKDGLDVDLVETAGGKRVVPEHQMQMRVEIILEGGQERYSIEADKFHCRPASGQKGGSVTAELMLLVRDLVSFAPHALLNRGAYMLVQPQPDVFLYPTKNAYYEEIVWRLYRLARSW